MDNELWKKQKLKKKIQHNLAISLILFDIIVNGTELEIRI